MVLRPDAVRDRLLKLEEVISKLDELRRSTDSTANFRDEWAVERGLQLGAELVFDIGNHILSAHFGVSPTDYEDIVTQLASHTVIGEELRQRLRGLGGFRNILVRDYLRIDPAVVSAHAKKAPRDFSAFAAAVRAWLVAVVADSPA